MAIEKDEEFYSNQSDNYSQFVDDLIESRVENARGAASLGNFLKQSGKYAFWGSVAIFGYNAFKRQIGVGNVLGSALVVGTSISVWRKGNHLANDALIELTYVNNIMENERQLQSGQQGPTVVE